MATMTLPSTVQQRGQFYVTTVRDIEFKTNLSLSGFWVNDRQIDGTAQRSFRSLQAFRRHAVRVYHDRYDH